MGTGNHGTWLFATKTCVAEENARLSSDRREKPRGFRYHEVKNDGKKNGLVIGQIA